MTDDKPLDENEIKLKLLYLGHGGAEIAILSGALESAGIPFIPKRDFGLQSHAPSVFFSPGTEVKVYVSERDWPRAVEMAQTVLGENWEEPPPDEGA